MKSIKLHDWRRRVNEAWSRGKFTKDDLDVLECSPRGCIKGELGNIILGEDKYNEVGKKFPITDELELIMMRAVRYNDVESAEAVLNIMEQIPSLYDVRR